MTGRIALALFAAAALAGTNARADDEEAAEPAPAEQAAPPARHRAGKHKASTQKEKEMVAKARLKAGKGKPMGKNARGAMGSAHKADGDEAAEGAPAGKHKASSQKEKEMVAKARLKSGKGKQINPRLKGKGRKVEESAPAAESE